MRRILGLIICSLLALAAPARAQTIGWGQGGSSGLPFFVSPSTAAAWGLYAGGSAYSSGTTLGQLAFADVIGGPYTYTQHSFNPTNGLQAPLLVGSAGNLHVSEPDWAGTGLTIAAATTATAATCASGYNGGSTLNGTTTAGCVAIPITDSMGTIRLSLTNNGTFGTISIYGLMPDGTTTGNLNYVNPTSGILGQTFSANNVVKVNIGGWTAILLVQTSAGSGTTTIAYELSAADSVTALVTPLPNGGNNIGFISETYANIATNQVTVGVTATLIVAARTGRKNVTIFQEGNTLVRVGASGVALATGVPLIGTQGANLVIDGGAAVYGIAGSSELVSFMEVY
jgi:hypothetical protein